MGTGHDARSVTLTLSGTTADTVTLDQLWPQIQITNSDATNTLWVRVGSTATPTAAVAGGAGCVPVLPSSTRVVQTVPIQTGTGVGTVVMSVVGNGGSYTVTGVNINVGNLSLLDSRYQQVGTSTLLPTVTDAPHYYVSKGALASDNNNGLSWGTAFASVAGALTAIGGTATTTNAAIIEIGAGTFGTSGAGLPNHLILSATGFIIKGQGKGVTSLWGPNAAALFTFVNNRHSFVDDLTYLGSPNGTGWLWESGYDSSAGTQSPEYCGARRVLVGNHGGLGARTAAYGFRWILYGGLAANDGGNDKGYLEDVTFDGVGQCVSIEHGNSLWHKFVNCTFAQCDGAVKLQGGSFDAFGGAWGGSSCSGWLVDFQPCIGATTNADAYHHGSSWTGLQSEGGAANVGWARSNVLTVKTVTNAERDVVRMSFVNCELNAGGISGVSSNIIDWQSPSENTGLEFTNCELRPRSGCIAYMPSANSHLSVRGGRCSIANFNWGGTLDFTIPPVFFSALPTLTPITGATVLGVVQPVVVTEPTVPPVGFGQQYWRSHTGRARLWQQASGQVASGLADELWMHQWWQLLPGISTSMRVQGHGNFTNVGTISHPAVSSNGYFVNVVSAASANATATVSCTGASWLRSDGTKLNEGFFFHGRINLPDASYDNTGASTGSRVWCGMSSNVSVVATNAGDTLSVAAFRRLNVNGGTTEANWQFVTNNNGTGTATVADTGIPFVAAHVYSMSIWCPRGSSTIYWRIRDLTAATAAVEGSATGTLPVSTTGVGPIYGLNTVDAVARNVQFRGLFVTSDTD